MKRSSSKHLILITAFELCIQPQTQACSFCEGRNKGGGREGLSRISREEKGYIGIPTLFKFDPAPFKRLNSPSMGTTQQLFHQLEI